MPDSPELQFKKDKTIIDGFVAYLYEHGYWLSNDRTGLDEKQMKDIAKKFLLER